MSTGYVIGGAKFAQFFTASETAGTVGTTAIFTYGKQVSTDVQKDDSGNYTIAIDGIQDSEAFSTYLDTYFSTYGASAGEEILFETGDKLGASGGNPTQLAIVYGGKDADSSSSSYGKRKVFVGLVKGNMNSGAWKQEGEKYNRPTLGYTGVDAEATVTVATTYFLATVVSTPAQVVITAALKKGRVVWM